VNGLNAAIAMLTRQAQLIASQDTCILAGLETIKQLKLAH
jgi:hypothetical protein